MTGPLIRLRRLRLQLSQSTVSQSLYVVLVVLVAFLLLFVCATFVPAAEVASVVSVAFGVFAFLFG